MNEKLNEAFEKLYVDCITSHEQLFEIVHAKLSMLKSEQVQAIGGCPLLYGQCKNPKPETLKKMNEKINEIMGEV